MGPTKLKNTVLSPAEEAVIVEFRSGTLLPLDDVMGCLRHKHCETDLFKPAPLLGSGMAFHGCQLARSKSLARDEFAPSKIGYVPIDSAELHPAEGKVNEIPGL